MNFKRLEFWITVTLLSYESYCAVKSYWLDNAYTLSSIIFLS